MAETQSVIPIIRDADRGRVLSDMQEEIDNIVDGIEANRGVGVGKVTLTLTIKSKSEGTYTISADVKAKIPEPSRADMIMFLGDDGELQRRDPRQPDLPGVTAADFRSVAQDQ